MTPFVGQNAQQEAETPVHARQVRSVMVFGAGILHAIHVVKHLAMLCDCILHVGCIYACKGWNCLCGMTAECIVMPDARSRHSAHRVCMGAGDLSLHAAPVLESLCTQAPSLGRLQQLQRLQTRHHALYVLQTLSAWAGDLPKILEDDGRQIQEVGSATAEIRFRKIQLDLLVSE